jgi:hypothetical protein
MVAHHPMTAMTRLVLRVILLYADGKLTRPCLASDATVAARASLSPVRVRAVRRQARREGLAWGGTVTLAYDDAATAELRRLWSAARRLGERWAGNRLRPAEEALLRVREPALFIASDGLTDEESAERVEAATADFVSRFDWMRAVVDHGPYARPRCRRSQMALLKAVAFAVDLLMDSHGRPYRWLTVAEVARLAGYRGLARVRWALRRLEQDRWLTIGRRDGWRDGLLLSLRVPERVREQWRRERETMEEGGSA